MPHEPAPPPGAHGIGVPEDELVLGDVRGAPVRYNLPNSLVTIGASGTGKFATTIAPNLLHYAAGSVIVFDPKGEIAAVTAEFRRKLGKVHIVNPFEVLPRTLPQSSGFNALEDLDPKSKTFTSDAGALAAAIAPEGPDSRDSFFKTTARDLIAAFIGHLRHQNSAFPQDRMNTLVDVSDAVNAPQETFRSILGHMRESPFALVRDAALDMQTDGGGKQESVLDTLRTARNELKRFLAADSIRDCLARSDFKWSDLRREKTTVYVVIPEAEGKAFNRFTRLLLASSLKALLRMNEDGDQLPVYYVLDELATTVGDSELELIETAVSLARGYGIRMHLFFQNYGQMKSIFKDRVSSIESGAGVMQFFQANDEETFEKIRSRAGKTTRWFETGSRQQSSGVSGGTSGGGRENSGWNRGESAGNSEHAIPVDVIDHKLVYELGHVDNRQSAAGQILFFRGLASPVLARRTAYFAQPYFMSRAMPNPYVKPSKR